jgi:hypothetical protein
MEAFGNVFQDVLWQRAEKREFIAYAREKQLSEYDEYEHVANSREKKLHGENTWNSGTDLKMKVNLSLSGFKKSHRSFN